MKTNFSRVMATMALRFRDNLAVVNVERDRRYTYGEYHRLTNRIAHMMRHALGLGAGDTVLLILENDNLSLLHFPAIYKQAATFVFSNLRDSPEEQARQIDHVNQFAIAQGNGPCDAVLQFADISRPLIIEQALHRRGSDL